MGRCARLSRPRNNAKPRPRITEDARLWKAVLRTQEQAWYIVRHEDIESVFRDKTTSSDRLSGYFGRLPPDKQAILEPLFNDLKRWLIFVDEPDHKRVRSPMQRVPLRLS